MARVGPTALVALALLACRRGAPSPTNTGAAKTPTTHPVEAIASPASSSHELAPLSNVAWIERLDLADGREAYICPPIGAREPRPLVVAVHGAGDRAEWSCGGWRMAAHEYAFVACPQGLKMDAMRFAWDKPETIRSRVAEAIAAARARFGEYIAEGPTVYVGFSQGASLASATLLDPAEHFPVIALAEGGYNLYRNSTFIEQLRQRGTERVLLVCGGPACFSSAEARASRLRAQGLELLIAGDPLSGHNLNGRMQAALQRVWPEFVAGLPNWRGFHVR